jgi:Galactose oxidase, central domain
MVVQQRTSHFLCGAALSALFAVLATGLSLAAEPTALTWTQLTAAGFPARAGFATAYDPISQKVVAFGGRDVNGIFYSDTWTFDGATWQKIQTKSAPTGRAGAAMAYDTQTKTLVLFGGFSGFIIFNDTWLWDGSSSTWKQAHPKHKPSAALNAMLFTDPANGHADMFGGKHAQFYSRDTLQWTGKDWTLLAPTNSPYPRDGAVNAFDPVHNNIVVFGGLSDNWITQNTWTWDGTDWTEKNVKKQPDTLYFTSGAYDPALKKVVVFSGGSGGVDQTTTWAWTGSKWMSLTPATSPTPREQFGTVWDPATSQFLIFGGTNFHTGDFFSDTWMLEGK